MMKQHYLPQCYLKEFVNREGKLHTLDVNLIKHRRAVFDQQRTTAEVCRSIDYYTLKPPFSKSFQHLTSVPPLFLENEFQKYEREYSKIVSKIKNKQKALIMSDYKLLIYALVDIKIRNPYFRKVAITDKKEEVMNEIISEAKAAISLSDMSKFPNLTEQGIKNAFESLTSIVSDRRYDSLTHLSSLVMRKQSDTGIHEKITQHLLQFRWNILQSKNRFITTDNPGISIDKNNKVQNTKFDKDFFFFMPLTPSMCLAISPKVPDQKFFKTGAQKSLYYLRAEDDVIDMVNEMHGYHLTQFIFSNNKNTIDEIAKAINMAAGLT